MYTYNRIPEYILLHNLHFFLLLVHIKHTLYKITYLLIGTKILSTATPEVLSYLLMFSFSFQMTFISLGWY